MEKKVGKIIVLLVLCIVFVSTFFYYSNNDNSTAFEFIDNGVSSDYNDDWKNWNMSVIRYNDFTKLSSNSNSSLWYMANKTIYGDFVVEWDSYWKPDDYDYCIISNINKSEDIPLNFVKNLGITGDCHVKLIVKNNIIEPYVNDVAKNNITFKSKQSDGLMFRFQINNNGSDISYSNFKIYSI